MMKLNAMLAKELKDTMDMKRKYESALKELPEGCLAVRKIRGHDYYYLVRRNGKKVEYIYKGKISHSERIRFEEVKLLRARYRSLIAKMKKQIKALNSMLRKDMELHKVFSS